MTGTPNSQGPTPKANSQLANQHPTPGKRFLFGSCELDRGLLLNAQGYIDREFRRKRDKLAKGVAAAV